ncbi:hypothetical protein EYV94_13195 [Puteibacter caeruleilacunae]|nr:hypothetical protein EYV94_13195 [Puteibacter caeruleilacunae]
MKKTITLMTISLSILIIACSNQVSPYDPGLSEKNEGIMRTRLQEAIQQKEFLDSLLTYFDQNRKNLNAIAKDYPKIKAEEGMDRGAEIYHTPEFDVYCLMYFGSIGKREMQYYVCDHEILHIKVLDYDYTHPIGFPESKIAKVNTRDYYLKGFDLSSIEINGNRKWIALKDRKVLIDLFHEWKKFNIGNSDGCNYKLFTLEKVKAKFSKEYTCADTKVLDRFYITQKEAILSKEVFDVDTIFFRGKMHLLLLSKTIPKKEQHRSGLTVSLVNADVVDIHTGEPVYSNCFTQAGSWGDVPDYTKIKSKYQYLISIDHGSTRMGYMTGYTEVYGFVGFKAQLKPVLRIEDSFYDNEGAVGRDSQDRKYYSTSIEFSSEQRNTLIVHKKGNNIDETTTYKYNRTSQSYEEVK